MNVEEVFSPLVSSITTAQMSGPINKTSRSMINKTSLVQSWSKQAIGVGYIRKNPIVMQPLLYLYISSNKDDLVHTTTKCTAVVCWYCFFKLLFFTSDEACVDIQHYVRVESRHCV